LYFYDSLGGEMSGKIQIGTTGPSLKDSAGTVQVRTNADDAFAPVQCSTMTTSNLQATGGNLAGVTVVENFTTATNPVSSAAVTTAIVDAYNGTVITLTTTGNAQTMSLPTGAAVRKFTVINNDTSTNTIAVNGITIGVGKSQSFIYDGTAWTPYSLGITALPVPINQGGTNAITAAGARTAFGLTIGADIMAYEAWSIHEIDELCSVD
jgi:hypothetical protein